jgi:hypothetical protein
MKNNQSKTLDSSVIVESISILLIGFLIITFFHQTIQYTISEILPFMEMKLPR